MIWCVQVCHNESWDIVFIFRFSISNIFVINELQYIHDSKPKENVAVREGRMGFWQQKTSSSFWKIRCKSLWCFQVWIKDMKGNICLRLRKYINGVYYLHFCDPYISTFLFKNLAYSQFFIKNNRVFFLATVVIFILANLKQAIYFLYSNIKNIYKLYDIWYTVLHIMS